MFLKNVSLLFGIFFISWIISFQQGVEALEIVSGQDVCKTQPWLNWCLVISNVALLPAAIYSWKERLYYESMVFILAMFSSTTNHLFSAQLLTHSDTTPENNSFQILDSTLGFYIPAMIIIHLSCRGSINGSFHQLFKGAAWFFCLWLILLANLEASSLAVDVNHVRLANQILWVISGSVYVILSSIGLVNYVSVVGWHIKKMFYWKFFMGSVVCLIVAGTARLITDWLTHKDYCIFHSIWHIFVMLAAYFSMKMKGMNFNALTEDPDRDFDKYMEPRVLRHKEEWYEEETFG